MVSEWWHKPQVHAPEGAESVTEDHGIVPPAGPGTRSVGWYGRHQMGDARGESDSGEAPAPAKGFRMSGRVLVSRPFRVIGPRVIPPFHRAISRLTGGRTLFDSAAQPMLTLTTRGSRTGQRRETPLAAVPLERGRFLVVGSNFARERHPAWTANLLANPDAEILFRGRRTPVRARLLEGDERQRRWQTAVGWFPGWIQYVTVTDREFRLFELVPLADPP